MRQKFGEYVKVGDSVECRVYTTTRGDLWIPATIAHVSNSRVILACDDGERRTFPRKMGQWRRLKSGKDKK